MKESVNFRLVNSSLPKNYKTVRRRVVTAGRSFYAPFKRPGAEPAVTDVLDVQESKYLYYCALVHEAALELNPKTRNPFLEIINATKSDGMASFQNETIAIKKYVQENNNTEFLKPLIDLPEEYEKPLSDCIGLVGPYIKSFFNHDIENPKIKPNSLDSGYLTLAIGLCALVESREKTFDDVNRAMMGESYWVLQDKTDDISNRPDRRQRHAIVELAQELGWHLIKEEPLYELAKLWYVARVIKNDLAKSLIGEYQIPGTDTVISLPKIYHPATAFRNIHDFDLATGYAKP
jgi:hypothetical protein